MTDDPYLQDVIDRELRLQAPAVRRAPEIAGELLDPEFREFGASGRAWDRASVLAVMADHDAAAPVTDEVAAARLVADVVLLTYRTRRPGRTALRSSLWRRDSGGPWRVYFHQATVVPATGGAVVEVGHGDPVAGGAQPPGEGLDPRGAALGVVEQDDIGHGPGR